MKQRVIAVLFFSVAILLVATGCGPTAIVSLSSAATQGDGDSRFPGLASDSPVVVFSSDATDLVSGDTNGKRDIFVRDLVAGTTKRVSVSSSGAQANGNSYDPVISANGRYVAFESEATNLVAGDTNGLSDIFVYDRQTETTTRVSVSSSGTQGNGTSAMADISGDGRYVAFASGASNLVAGDTNIAFDVFVRDRLLNMTFRVSVATDGTQGNSDSLYPAISADGNYVAFGTAARYFVSGDTNEASDVFRRNGLTNETTLVSRAWNGGPANNAAFSPSISADGRFVAFTSRATNHNLAIDSNGKLDIYVYDMQEREMRRASVPAGGGYANDDSFNSSISADGKYVIFSSHATNMVSGDNNGVMDIFARNMANAETTRVSLTGGNAESNGASDLPMVSASGQYVVFESSATNLVLPPDNNGKWDIFIRDRFYNKSFVPTIMR